MPVSSHLVRAGHSQIGVGPLAYGKLLRSLVCRIEWLIYRLSGPL